MFGRALASSELKPYQTGSYYLTIYFKLLCVNQCFNTAIYTDWTLKCAPFRPPPDSFWSVFLSSSLTSGQPIRLLQLLLMLYASAWRWRWRCWCFFARPCRSFFISFVNSVEVFFNAACCAQPFALLRLCWDSVFFYANPAPLISRALTGKRLVLMVSIYSIKLKDICVLFVRWEYRFRANNHSSYPYLYMILSFLLFKCNVGGTITVKTVQPKNTVEKRPGLLALCLLAILLTTVFCMRCCFGLFFLSTRAVRSFFFLLYL